MKKTTFPGGLITDSVEAKELQAESIKVGGTSAGGVIVKAAAPTSEKAAVGTLWVKQDASAPEVYICVAVSASAGTWKKLSFAT